MKTLSQENKAGETHTSPEEKQKRIDAHKIIAGHLYVAAKHHHEAAKYHEENNEEKAFECSLTAHEHLSIANDTEEKESTTEALHPQD